MKSFSSYLIGSLLISGLLIACKPSQPRLAASFWLKTTAADSLTPGYRVITGEGQTRHIVPITEWTASPEVDTYHQLHHHGVALESELMAYRIYFDRKQTIDVYAKKTPRLELPTSYWYPSDEQLAEHYGDDVLRVSGTVGLGAVKPWHNGKMQHIEPVQSRTQRLLYLTPDSAAMEVSVSSWQTEGKTVDMTVRYTLFAGHRDMRCEVFLSAPLDSLCTGVQFVPFKNGQHSGLVLSARPNNSEAVPMGSSVSAMAIAVDEAATAQADGTIVASWGTDWPVNDSAKYAKETVGLGVYVPREYVATTLQDARNNLVLFRPATYLRFYLTCVAQKEDNPPVRSREDFPAFLLDWANQCTNY